MLIYHYVSEWGLSEWTVIQGNDQIQKLVQLKIIICLYQFLKLLGIAETGSDKGTDYETNLLTDCWSDK